MNLMHQFSSVRWGQQLGQLGNYGDAINFGQGAQAAKHKSLIQGEQLQAHHARNDQTCVVKIINRPIQVPGGLAR
jgi:hypothetical protein